MVFERISDHSLPCVFIAVTTFCFWIVPVSRLGDAGMAARDPILYDDLAVVQCRFGAIGLNRKEKENNL
jgi:hypothetical protein